MSEKEAATLSLPPLRTARPDAAISLSFNVQQSPSALNAEGWQRFIDDYLVDWGARGVPDLDDDQRPPTQTVIAAAVKIAEMMGAEGAPPPSRVIPNGEGGLIFERYSYPNVYEAFEIFEDLRSELRSFQDSKLVNPE